LKKNLFLIFIISCTTLFAQKTKQVFVKYINTKITEINVDGILNEADWAKAKTATNYWQYFPTDSLKAKNQTEIKMMFDDKNLYVGIRVNAKSNKFIIPSLRRDFRVFWKRQCNTNI